jgi:hypothetical protein
MLCDAVRQPNSIRFGSGAAGAKRPYPGAFCPQGWGHFTPYDIVKLLLVRVFSGYSFVLNRLLLLILLLYLYQFCVTFIFVNTDGKNIQKDY